eukprot:365455-Chlamydomonas_euryale.AAC.12
MRHVHRLLTQGPAEQRDGGLVRLDGHLKRGRGGGRGTLVTSSLGRRHGGTQTPWGADTVGCRQTQLAQTR